MTITREFREAIDRIPSTIVAPRITLTVPGIWDLAMHLGFSDPSLHGPVYQPLPSFLLIDPISRLGGKKAYWCAEYPERAPIEPGERWVRYVAVIVYEGRLGVETVDPTTGEPSVGWLEETPPERLAWGSIRVTPSGRAIIHDEIGLAGIPAAVVCLLGGLVRKREVVLTEVTRGRGPRPLGELTPRDTYIIRNIERVIRRATHRATQREATGRRVRAHHVIGHWRGIGTPHERWVDSYLRGDIALGFVHKDHRLDP